EEYKKAKKELENTHKVQKNELERHLSDVADWTFRDYVQHLLVPYWKLDHTILDQAGDLGVLLESAPNYVQAVVAADDPLNDPKELLALRKKIQDDKLLVLPYGGHLGFVGTRWGEQLILKFFAKE